jgi:hypothetical protein
MKLPLLDETEIGRQEIDFIHPGDQGRLLDWILVRPTVFRGSKIKKLAFSIDKTINLDLKWTNLNAGYIKLNTIDVKSSTPGVNYAPYPWSGIYFNTTNYSYRTSKSLMPGYTFLIGQERWVYGKITIVLQET